MSDEVLIKKLAASVEGVPSRAEVYAVRQYALDEMEYRADRFLSTVAEVYCLSMDRGDWNVREDRTLIRMPFGARAVVYHASGAMKFVAGLEPMDALFEKVNEREALVKLVEEAVDRLQLREWVGEDQSLSFERLWQIKASAADREGKTVEPVLCRVVGAYRHFVGKFPVWGAASVAVKLAGEGQLDSVTVQIRESTGEVIDSVPILPPDRAAYQVLLQLSGLMGKSRMPLSEIVQPQFFQFGYLSLSKRKPQRLLAPVYVAALDIVRQDEAQAYVLVVPATEKTYLPISLYGSEAFPARIQRNDATTLTA